VWTKEHDMEILSLGIDSLCSVITDELVYDDGDMYYKVNPKKYVRVLGYLMGKKYDTKIVRRVNIMINGLLVNSNCFKGCFYYCEKGDELNLIF
jgi:hypothetical protein